MDYFRNRSWMYKRKAVGQIGPSDEFYAGVEAFLEYAYRHPFHVVDGKIRCPCKKCKLNTYEERNMVSYHLVSKGFMSRYDDFWWAHGQVRIPLAAQVAQNEDNSVYRMNEMVHDAAGSNFDSEERREEPITPDAEAFYGMLEKSKEPLWNGCTKQSQMCPKWREEKWTKKSTTASANRSVGTPPGGRAPGTYRGGTKSQSQYMMEQTQSEGGSQRNRTEVYAPLRTNIPGVDAISEQYDTLMAAKYPEGSPRPDFDQDVWTVASGGAKKGYVKSFGHKRSRPSSFTACAFGSSSVGGSTSTSAAPISEQSAYALVRAICADLGLLSALEEAVLSDMTAKQIGVHLAQLAQSSSSSSQASANAEGTAPPTPPQGN